MRYIQSSCFLAHFLLNFNLQQTKLGIFTIITMSQVADERVPSALTPRATLPKGVKKKKILSPAEYLRICQFINNYHGLPIDCELVMVHQLFTDIEPFALTCILQTQRFTKMRGQFWRHEQRAKQLLQTFESQRHMYSDNALLIRMAVVESINPVALCRILVQEKYDLRQKGQVSRLLKYPHLIQDHCLAANVQQCLCSDNQEGPITDLRRRIIGEEYELKLKQLARAAGMHYYDEQDLRRMGYDKTPDIKMILPFLYKGAVVNWVESKANFGDPKSHKFNIQQQLHSYCNRFGPGIIIYWFGYHEETAQLTENNIGITVLADFPSSEDVVLMHLTDDTTALVPHSTIIPAETSDESKSVSHSAPPGAT